MTGLQTPKTGFSREFIGTIFGGTRQQQRISPPFNARLVARVIPREALRRSRGKSNRLSVPPDNFSH